MQGGRLPRKRMATQSAHQPPKTPKLEVDDNIFAPRIPNEPQQYYRLMGSTLYLPTSICSLENAPDPWIWRARTHGEALRYIRP